MARGNRCERSRRDSPAWACSLCWPRARPRPRVRRSGAEEGAKTRSWARRTHQPSCSRGRGSVGTGLPSVRIIRALATGQTTPIFGVVARSSRPRSRTSTRAIQLGGRAGRCLDERHTQGATGQGSRAFAASSWSRELAPRIVQPRCEGRLSRRCGCPRRPPCKPGRDLRRGHGDPLKRPPRASCPRAWRRCSTSCKGRARRC